jgi:hypothetical protein
MNATNATAWPLGHLIVLEPGTTKMGRCDCGGMSASNPSHTAMPIVTTDSLTAFRALRDQRDREQAESSAPTPPPAR